MAENGDREAREEALARANASPTNLDDIKSELNKDEIERRETIGWLLSNADYMDGERTRKDVWWQRFNTLKNTDNGKGICKRLLTRVKGQDRSWRYDDSGLESLKEHILTGRRSTDECEETQLGTSLSVRRYSDRACIVRNPGRDNENERIVIDGHFEVLEHLKVDGDDFWRVRQDEESLMNFRGLKTQLEGSSRVLSRRDLPDVLSTILRNCSNLRESHAAFGVYNHDGELVVCTDPVPVKEEGAKAWETVKGLVDREATSEEIRMYIDVQDYWHAYEILPSLGLGLIAPFAFFLRQNQVLVPHLFNYAPEMDLGKSLVALISSEKLYGYEHTSGPAINSHYRLPSQLDAICLPRTVDEAENLKGELWPALKESAERWLADKRGTPDLGMLDYLSRSVLLFTGNSLPISTESVLKRFLVVRFDSSAKLNRKRDCKELEMAYNSLQPIGFQLLRWALEEWPTAEEFLKEFREIEDAIRDAYQQWASPKRPQAWACVYMGLKILEIGCRQLGMDWKTPSIANFVQDVVQPIEAHTWGMRRNHVDRFVDWFDMWRVRQTITVRDGEYGESVQKVKGEYEVFKDALMEVGTEKVPGYWITSALLDEYNQRKDGEERISSLKDLSTQSADLLNLPYALILDKDSKVKTEKLGKKTARVAFIPRDLSEVLSKGLYRDWGDRVTSDEPDSVTHPNEKNGSRVTDEPEEYKKGNRHPVTRSSPTPLTQSEENELMRTALKKGITYDKQRAIASEGGLCRKRFDKWIQRLKDKGDIIDDGKRWRWMSR